MERKRSGLPVLCMLLTVLIVSLSVFTVAGDDNIVFDDYVAMPHTQQNAEGGAESRAACHTERIRGSERIRK